MRIGLIACPFIAVPPRGYGGTELFVANLARELHALGHDVTVYANGESSLPCRVRWRYDTSDWPPTDLLRSQLKNADHTAWAMREAAPSCDVIHVNDTVALPFTHFIDTPTALTIHHPHEPTLTENYMHYPHIQYVAIANWLARREPMPHVDVVHHGIPVTDYAFSADKDDYVVFLGRMVPCKAPHLAIQAARRAGMRLKLAGEIQPSFIDYWERQVLPELDGDRVEYVGEADFALKNALLSKARALLFPIEWEEPFGLVMIEAMACGTPVLAFSGGAVSEVVHDGINGWICRDVEDLAARIPALDVSAEYCREFVQQYFSVRRMANRYVRLYQRLQNRAGAEPVPADVNGTRALLPSPLRTPGAESTFSATDGYAVEESSNR
jgi:glycosyltransferase involved in cell wall biosynthesis